MFEKLKSPKALVRLLAVAAFITLAFLTPRFACSRAHPVTFGSVMTTTEKTGYDTHVAITSGNPHGTTAAMLVGGLPAASTSQAGTESLTDFTTFTQMSHVDRGYVDAVASGNQATLTGLAQTVDGVALSSAGQRVLLPAQTTSTQDGCYTIASGAWTRCVHMPVGLDAAGSSYQARFGTNVGVWVNTNATGSGIVGTNDLTFTNVVASYLRNVRAPTVVSSSPYTLLSTDEILHVDTSSARTLNLQDPALRRSYFIKDTVGSAATNNITLARFGSETIEGVAANKLLSANRGAWSVYSDGTNYWVTGP